ncbi:EAL domain-containing protein [Sulfurirhabdus autotrophica]|uniref:Diguanylate cyclase (GGDEF)-like protein n=1 Tax=Sulfurirhabdus autotrophica TaxID=1706046 RepID=A0A4R3Y6A2_9PROT|nr:EAL domain-containing protein [Sulfurirhabdus autotrophica]TCV87346.1 diguanylate cyclase (GGDEF)-like protein [Sulfurirhabdus autotrophica]
MNKWGIKGKILFLALMPAAAIALLLGVHFTSSRISDLEQSLENRGNAIVRQLAPASEYGVISGNHEILQNLTDAALREADVSAVSIYNISGTLLAESGTRVERQLSAENGKTHKIASVGSTNVLGFSAPVYQSEIKVDDLISDMPSDSKSADSIQPRKFIGKVEIELSLKNTIKRKNELLLETLFITLLGLVGSAMLAYRMSQGVTVPIYRLVDAVKKIGKGDLDVKVPEDSGGELKVLEQGINTMASRLKSSHVHMQEKILEATAKLSYQASHDMLTGLVNRREFECRLARALESAKSHGRTHVLCYLDLDQFKIVNDTCGHSGGDELLRQLTILLHAKVRERDTLARLGGDEFGVLLENCSLETARDIAEMLRQLVQDYRFVWNNKSFAVGVSSGLVVLNDESESVASVLSAADAACYAAKDRGRNCIHIYQPADSELLRRREEMQWVTRITRALEENRFMLYAQIIAPLCIQGEKSLHFEILLRMLDENETETILPMAFIPAAERYNMMKNIDRWVISNSFTVLSNVFENKPGGLINTYSINLSGASLGDEGFLEFITQQFEQKKVSPLNICFEITETAAILNLSVAAEFMRELKKLGCRFSLDDFGSGLSSFGYLKNLPVDYLKIDGAFVKDMADDPIDFAMVQSIHNIGHVMGLQTIAEFVESETVLKMLKVIGVDYAQGNWIGAPQPISKLYPSGVYLADTDLTHVNNPDTSGGYLSSQFN